MDVNDPLARFKSQFHFPKHGDNDVIYFCGNSLGLQPKNVAAAIETELTSWRDLAIGGYFGGTNPWLNYQEYTRATLAGMMGAKEEEITVMNALTVNLHLIMLSFYKPTSTRFKIIMEAGAFPSDQYAVERCFLVALIIIPVNFLISNPLLLQHIKWVPSQHLIWPMLRAMYPCN